VLVLLLEATFKLYVVVAEVLSFVLLLEATFELHVVAEVLSFFTGLFVASVLQLCCFFNWHWRRSWLARESIEMVVNMVSYALAKELASKRKYRNGREYGKLWSKLTN
jgi:hypothetical protein